MKLPTITDISLSRDWIDTFGGYNHNLKVSDGEWYDMMNMTSDHYPLLSNRAKRGLYTLPGTAVEGSNPIVHDIQGIIANDAMWYVDNGKIFQNKKEIPLGGEYTLSDGEKTLVTMGAYVIVFPDGIYVNSQNTDDQGKLALSKEITGKVTFKHCNLDGTVINIETSGDKSPSSPENMQYWLDTSGNKAVLKQYSASSYMWVSVATTYIKICATNIGVGIEEGDGITISGIKTADKGLNDLNNTSIVWKRDNDYIVVIGIMGSTTNVLQDSSKIKVERRIPEMDYVCESGNRLWGCKYGKNADEQIVNEIYASKLGDFKNWNCFAGVSTDSYAASVGTDGEWTGAISYLGYPMFFKENWVHTVYGSYPAQYNITATSVRGVQKTCSKSLAIVDEKLFYKSRAGVMVFGGSLPTSISEPLGVVSYDNAVGGAFGSKYYLSMRDSLKDKYSLFVYDAARGMWHKEDDLQIKHFCEVDNTLYAATSENEIIELANPVDKASEKSVEWYVETGKIGLYSPDKKYLSRIDIRMSLELGASARISVQYDSMPTWEHLTTLTGTKLGSFSVPVKPKRCDHMRLRIEGKGDVKIYSICKTTEQGSDR